MITILVLVTLALTNALEPEKQNSAEVKSIVSKYFQKVPDIDTKYVLNQGLSKAIWRYFKGKVNAFPLFQIKLKIDRNPVKIPWELQENNNRAKVKDGKKYRIMRIKSSKRREKATTPLGISPETSIDTAKSQAPTDTTVSNDSTSDTSTIDVSTTEPVSTDSIKFETNSTDAAASQPSLTDQTTNATSANP